MFQKLIIKKIPFSSLREYMEKKKLSRKELAKQLGITEQYLSFILSGKRTFSRKLAFRISEITGIPVENLIR